MKYKKLSKNTQNILLNIAPQLTCYWLLTIKIFKKKVSTSENSNGQ